MIAQPGVALCILGTPSRCLAGRDGPLASGRGQTSIHYGTVRWCDGAKGFAFISPEDGSADVFMDVWATSSTGFRSRQARQRVSDEVTEDAKGAHAPVARPAA